MIQHLDLDSLANIFSFLPGNHRGKSVQLLKCVCKHFYNLFSVNYVLDQQQQYSDYFRNVFRSMFVPKIYVQLGWVAGNGSEFDGFVEMIKLRFDRIFGDRYEALSNTEFELELDFPSEEKNCEYLSFLSQDMRRQKLDERDRLLQDEKHFDLRKQLLNWKFNSKDSLTLNNFHNWNPKRKINAFRFLDKLKFHFQIVTGYRHGEQEESTCKYFNTIQVWNNAITDSNSVLYELKDGPEQPYGIVHVLFKNFIRYAEKYGEFELEQLYNRKELDELQEISQKGSHTDLIDYLTISRNIIHHFTRSILANNTKLIRYSSMQTGFFRPKIHNALGIIENLSLVPWNLFNNNTRMKFSSVILYHLLEDELNISPEYLEKYRHIHLLPHDNEEQEQRITFGTTSHNFVLNFQTIEFDRTLAIIRNNVVKIPFYPSECLQGFSHQVRSDQISTFPTSLDSINDCCMKYCTFNTITAPLWCFPCCCWWGGMTCCCLYPLCYRLDTLNPLDSKHRCMSCFDGDVCLFVSASTLCYPCCLLKARVTGGPYQPEARSWTVAEDKMFGPNNHYCNIL